MKNASQDLFFKENLQNDQKKLDFLKTKNTVSKKYAIMEKN